MKAKTALSMQALILCILVSMTVPATVWGRPSTHSTTTPASIPAAIPDEFCIGPQPNLFVPDNFSTIQRAIDNASEGDVILVRPGVYYERPYIYKNITLIGEDEQTTIIDGVLYSAYSLGSISYYEEIIVSIYASGAKIMRFTIADGDIGVFISSGESPVISDVGVYGCIFKNIALEAIHAENCEGCIFEGNTVEESETGISSTGGEGNAIEDNKLAGNEVAIDVAGSHDRIRHNNISGGATGIRLANGTDDLIEFNTIANMTGNSIEAVASKGATLNGNEIFGGLIGTCGIMLEDSTGGLLSNNLVGGMNGAGIFLMGSHGNILEGTETLGNLVGILLGMSDDNSIRGGRSEGESNGLILNHSDGNTIFNRLFRDSETGIMLDHSDNNSLLFLLFLKNHFALVLDESNGLIFDTNFLQGNEFGLLSHGSSKGRIRRSLFFLNGVAAQLEDSGGFLIEDNMFAHDGEGVVLLRSSGGHLIFHNLFVTCTTAAVGDGISNWDNGSEGNFWSAYSGRDENGDGIGDTPFLNLDRYPLMTIGYVESRPVKDIFKDLREEIAALNLGKGTTNSLFAKINAAEKSYFQKGNVGAAQNQLQALINEINALKRSRRMSSAMAETLIAKIKAIMTLMMNSDSDFDDLSYEQERRLRTNPSSIDTDGDGTPDGWEVANGLNPLNPRDAKSDIDGDGLSNLDEYQAYGHMDEFSIIGIHGVTPELIQQIEHFEKELLATNGGKAIKAIDPYPIYAIAIYIAEWHTHVWVLDSDMDGLSDSYENSIGTNPMNWDTDGDHMSDGWEVKYGLNPNKKHTTWWESLSFIFHMYGDPDADSICNRYEYWMTQMFAPSSVNYLEMDPGYKDLIVQVDWVPSFEPDWNYLNVPKTPFSNHAIKLHIIRGAELDSKYAVFSGTDPNDFYQERSNLLHADSRLDTTRSWKGLVRFAISIDTFSGTSSSGNAYAIPNDMFAIAHCADSGWVATSTAYGTTPTTPECAVAGTFMHELGHTLGLHHGGDVDTNYKENYDSIMNYKYQIVGTDVTGDKVGDGGTKPATQVVNYSDGSHGTGDFDDWNHVVSHLGDGITHNGP